MKREKKTYAGNPIITSIFTADPSAHSWDGETIYIYASHDMDPARGCDLMDHYHVFSSTDMANWRDEGEILCSDDVRWGRPEGGFMWAPDCAFKDGTYYFYYPHPSDSKWNDSWKMGVAKSDEPMKGFSDIGYIEGLGGFGMIDPCVFVDDDGEAYMYYGGAGMCHCGTLDLDMVHLKGEMNPIDTLADFHEATWVFKKEDMYYLMYSDNVQPCNRMRYAMSKHPLGPWEEKGIMLEPVGCETTHGSITEFKGKWYLFYHNAAISDHGNLRSICVDELFFNKDGTIQIVKQTKQGILAVDDSCAALEGKDYTVTNDSNDRYEFHGVIAEKGGRASLRFSYEPKEENAKFRLFVNGKDMQLMNFVRQYHDADITVKLNEGRNQITLQRDTGLAVISSLNVALLDE